MADAFVERAEVPVLRVKADVEGSGPPGAFAQLESKLPTLRGRRFYGTFRLKDGVEEYYACVERIARDDPLAWEVETGVIPGGLYLRRRLVGSEEHIPHLPRLFREMIESSDLDDQRPSVEFYRSQTELQLLLPVRSRSRAAGSSPG
jgi:hypothetical protein